MAERKWFEGRVRNISGKLFCFAATANEATKLVKKATRRLLMSTDTAFVNQPTIKQVADNAVPDHTASVGHSYVISERGERIPLFH